MKLSILVLKGIGRVIDAQSKLGIKPDFDAEYYAIIDERGNMLDHYNDSFEAMEHAETFSRAGKQIEVVHKGISTARYFNGRDIG